MREFDNDTIKIITMFENITGSEVRDCLLNEEMIYFLVNPGKAAMAIGKGGQMIKIAEKMLKKPIKVYEYSEDVHQFVKNLIPQAQKIKIENGNVSVSVGNKERGIVIGRAGSKIKKLRELLVRNSDLKDLRIV